MKMIPKEKDKDAREGQEVVTAAAQFEAETEQHVLPSKSHSNRTQEPEFNAFELLLEASKLVDMNEEFIEKQHVLPITKEEKKKKSPVKVAPFKEMKKAVEEIPVVPKIPPWRQELFEERPEELENAVMRVLIEEGVDREDLKFLKEVSDDLLVADQSPAWIKIFHWVDHPPTIRPLEDNLAEPNEGGSARCTPYKRATRRILHLRKNATVDATIGKVWKFFVVSLFSLEF
jgi:hypothetical protein